MNQTIRAEGSCLCNAVTFQADSMVKEVGACHCNMCNLPMKSLLTIASQMKQKT